MLICCFRRHRGGLPAAPREEDDEREYPPRSSVAWAARVRTSEQRQLERGAGDPAAEDDGEQRRFAVGAVEAICAAGPPHASSPNLEKRTNSEPGASECSSLGGSTTETVDMTRAFDERDEVVRAARNRPSPP